MYYLKNLQTQEKKAVPFHVGAYMCMGAYKRRGGCCNQMGAYIHGVVILHGCLLYGMPLSITTEDININTNYV